MVVLNHLDEIERINRLLLQLASGNFSYREEVMPENNEMEGIITGINMLAEELESSTVSHDYLNSIFKGVVDMLVVLNSDNTIHQINDAVTKALGYSQKELIGKPFLFLFDGTNPDILKNSNEYLYRHGVCYNIEASLRSKTGALIPVSFSSSLLYNNEQHINGTLYIAKNISKLKKAENDLKVINHELKTFVYKASHDLKGPIASILGLTNVATLDLKDAPLDDVRGVALEYISLIQDSASMMNNILLNLIDITYLKQASMKIEPVDFEDLIQSIYNSLRFVKEYQLVELRLDIQPNILYYSDLKVLKSILQNLIENGLKYHKSDISDPWVSIVIRQEGENVFLKVQDNGIGIPQDAQAQIFDMFFRASNKSAGTGLGLYIVKNAVEQINGRIELLSQAEGTTFEIELPSLVKSGMELHESM